jgi:hypothetical protein
MTLNDDDFLPFFEALALLAPPIPVILTMPQVSDDFLALQMRARAAGAVDLIPLFRLVGSDFAVYRDALAQKVRMVFEAMGLMLSQDDALTAAATALRVVLRNETLF